MNPIYVAIDTPDLTNAMLLASHYLQGFAWKRSP